MSYWLGVDVGTTCTAAAICRQQPGQRVHLEVVPLGVRSAAVRSVVYLSRAGEVVIGEAAERRGAADPDRVVREFVPGVGDDMTMVIDGVEYSAAVPLRASQSRTRRAGSRARSVRSPLRWARPACRRSASAPVRKRLP
jgi:molecular chaperone DnaK (HSP70)